MDIKDKYRNLLKRGKRSQSSGEAKSSAKEFVYQSKLLVADTPANGAAKMSSMSRTQPPSMLPSEKPLLLPNERHMTLTIYNEKKNLVVSLKGSLLGSALLEFSRKEFKVDHPIQLRSQNLAKHLEPSLPINIQVPQFDLLQIVPVRHD